MQRADGQFPISYNPTDFADKAVLICPKPLRLLDCRPDIPSLSTARPLLSTATSPLMPCEFCCLVERRCALELGASGPGLLALSRAFHRLMCKFQLCLPRPDVCERAARIILTAAAVPCPGSCPLGTRRCRGKSAQLYAHRCRCFCSCYMRHCRCCCFCS